MNAVLEQKQKSKQTGAPAVLPLSAQEKSRLASCEKIIQNHFQTYREAGAALAEIRDKRLYRAQYSTFEVYCHVKWEMSKTQANRLIQAANVVESLSKSLQQKNPRIADVVRHLPESAVRPLTGLKPQQQVKAMEKATKQAPGGVTAKVIAQSAKEVAPEAFRSPRLAPGREDGNASDLIRKSELLENISHWEKQSKATGKFEHLTPEGVVREIRKLINQL